MSAHFDVVTRVHGAPEQVLEGGHGADPLVHSRVLSGDSPNPNLAVLVAGEDAVTGENYGFDQPAS